MRNIQLLDKEKQIANNTHSRMDKKETIDGKQLHRLAISSTVSQIEVANKKIETPYTSAWKRE